MALDTLDVVEGTVAGLGLGILYQAVEDRVPSKDVDLYTGAVAIGGYAGGLLLMNSNVRRGGGAFTTGQALAYGAAALAGAQATRYVDGKMLKLTVPAGYAGNVPQVERRAVPARTGGVVVDL
jgi:hypothetical protein